MNRHVDITMLCLNVLYAILDGSSWKGDSVISENHEKNFDILVRNKCIGCDMVNTLLSVMETKYMLSGNINREMLIESMRLLSFLLYLDEKPSIAITTDVMDVTKEFIVVSTIDHQLNIQERGPDALPIVMYGCEILVQYVRLFPDLRRNCTCRLIHRLLVDVYSIFVPEPYYFPCAIAVLNELLKNDMNLDHFQVRSTLIHKFLQKHNNSGFSERIVYKNLEEKLLQLSNSIL